MGFALVVRLTLTYPRNGLQSKSDNCKIDENSRKIGTCLRFSSAGILTGPLAHIADRICDLQLGLIESRDSR
jgi:hypothetical protein